jgi:hypothetical protein
MLALRNYTILTRLRSRLNSNLDGATRASMRLHFVGFFAHRSGYWNLWSLAEGARHGRHTFLWLREMKLD